ncbi:tetraspanin 35 [Kryptolebias marmoratus]|uniref:Tetraspanin n=1 Tax=Kryptolebias marmoratus TaxID=37003 RepID=A0A3Q3A283_KRYMA|nr:tetraspanin 35 [Kryptolebias marmoratus]
MGCFAFLKVTMFAFNGIIFLAGAAIMGVGIWVKVDSGSVLNFLGKIDGMPSELSQVLNVGYLLIAIGALLVIIGFLGCCGAIRENKCMLLLFFFIVLLVFIAEVAGAVVILVFRPVADKLFMNVGKAAVKSIQKDYGTNSDITGLWNSMMDTLKCCGFNNFTDFENSPYYNTHNSSYPPQCCRKTNDSCSHNEVQRENPPPPSPLVTGCFPMIKNLIDDNTVVIIAVALGIAALEICAMVVSMILYCRIKSTMA